MNLICLTLVLVYSGEVLALNCAISNERPPFQFERKGKAVGLDVDYVNLYNKHAFEKIQLSKMSWVDALAKLYFTKEIDCVWGIKDSAKASSRFLISKRIYKSVPVLFINKKSNFLGVSDLESKTVAADESFELNKVFKGGEAPKGLRIRKTKSHKESLSLLRDGKVFGAILPETAAKFMAKRMDLELRVAVRGQMGNGIGIAVKKNDWKTLGKIEKALERIPKVEVETVLKKWSLNNGE